jgi:hypothetical protein
MPSTPLRLQVIDRVVRVLESIQEGSEYFYSPKAVVKGFVSNPSAYPVYQVTSESGGEVQHNSDMQNIENFCIAVHGIVQSATDVVTPLEESIRDVRKAINDDFLAGGAADSLVALTMGLTMEETPDIAYGFESTGAFGYFTQKIMVKIFGEFGEL